VIASDELLNRIAEVLKAMALSQAMSPKIELSPELVESVKNYKYVPWVFNVPE